MNVPGRRLETGRGAARATDSHHGLQDRRRGREGCVRRRQDQRRQVGGAEDHVVEHLAGVWQGFREVGSSSGPSRKRRCGNELSCRKCLGPCPLGKFVSATPRTPLRRGQTIATPTLSPAGNPGQARPVTRRAAGPGLRAGQGWPGAGAHTQPRARGARGERHPRPRKTCHTRSGREGRGNSAESPSGMMIFKFV